MEVPIEQEDYERFLGRLYLERCQWQKAAEMLDEKLKALTTPTETP